MKPISILFVCHGNICRSTMAEFVMKDLLKKAGLSDTVRVESAATSTEEIGNPVHPGTQRILASKGISCEGKHARQMTRSDYDAFDLIVGMDDANIANIERIAGKRSEGKARKLLEFAGETRSIADPWYTGDFETTYEDVLEGCIGMLKAIEDDELL